MPDRIDWRYNLWCVWITQFLSAAAFSSAYTFLPFYLQHIGLGESDVNWYFALICGVGNFSFALAAPVWGMLADRYGRKMMLLRANFGAALLIPLTGFLTDPDWLVVHRLVCGVVTGTITASQTLILSTTPEDKRSFALGALSAAVFSGGIIGQFLGGPVVTWIGFAGTFIGCGVLLALAGMLVLFFAKENFEPVVKSFSFSWQFPSFGKIWILLVLFFFLSVSRDFGGIYTALLVDEIIGDHQIALRYAGYLSGIASIAAIASGLILGHLADRMKLLPLLLAALAGSALMRIPQGLADNYGVLLTFSCLFTFGCAGLDPLLQTWLAGSVPAQEHGRYFGWAACFKAVGWACASLFSGTVVWMFGDEIRSVFFVGSLLLLLAVPLALKTAKFVPPPERSRKGRRV